MNIKRFMLCAVVLTCVCLLYVEQQVSLVKLAYTLRDKEKALTEHVDRNRVLLYNNTSLKSPHYLAGMLEQNNIELKFPESTAVAKVRVIRKKNEEIAQTPGTGLTATILDTLVPKAQAALHLRR